MATLDGRSVYTRQDLMNRHGISLTPLETWYRNRHTSGHPESVGKIGRELVWDAKEWDRWYNARQDTTALESRTQLAARHGLAKGTIDQLWGRREENGHPEPVRTVNQTIYWNPAEWDAWYAGYKKRAQRTQLDVDRSGNPNDLITLSEAARVLGVEPTSITNYPKRPPRRWPQPVEEEPLPSGRLRRWYRRADIWHYADTRSAAGPHRTRHPEQEAHVRGGTAHVTRPQDDFGPVQLARWLGLKESQLRRAQNLGLLPPPDVDGRRWSQSVARTLPDQVERILAQLGEETSAAPATKPAPPARTRRGKEGFGPVQLARHLGLKDWQVTRAQQRGLIPAPDLEGGRWSQTAVEPLTTLVPRIVAELGDHPGLGSQKAAEHLAQHTGLAVERTDIQDLADRGALHPVGEFKGWPMYGIDALDALPRDQVSALLTERLSWIDASLTSAEAAGLLGWPIGRFEVTAERRGLTPGRFDRYRRTDVEQLAQTDS